MKIPLFLKLFLYILVIIFHTNCCGDKITNATTDDNKVVHHISLEGKKITFSLPKEYIDENVIQYAEKYDLTDFQKLFFSTKNDNSHFAIYTKIANYDTESLINGLLEDYEKTYYLGTVVFADRGQDKNDNPYVIFTVLRRYYCYEDYSDECILYKLLRESNSLESIIQYSVFIDGKEFIFVFRTIEKMNEYSYREKIKVMESISIDR